MGRDRGERRDRRDRAPPSHRVPQGRDLPTGLRSRGSRRRDVHRRYFVAIGRHPPPQRAPGRTRRREHQIPARYRPGRRLGRRVRSRRGSSGRSRRRGHVRASHGSRPGGVLVDERVGFVRSRRRERAEGAARGLPQRRRSSRGESGRFLQPQRVRVGFHASAEDARLEPVSGHRQTRRRPRRGDCEDVRARPAPRVRDRPRE
mmetsp:Transcript_8963/g.36640  ORF Transcript_8963/g.36640 Transcript_8963/m.36640 type:complete len:203 (+) Transcript_8963:215-823(+)